MARRIQRPLALGAVILGAAMALATSCAFPDPALVPDEASEAGTDAPFEDDGGSRRDALVDPDSSPPIGDASGEKPPVDANCDPCDCDGDGFTTDDAAACPDTGGRPRGDCDDLDPRAHPDAGFVKDPPTPDTLGDWNCDGKVNGQYGVGANCADYSGLTSIGTCPSVQGFVGNPRCGELTAYVFCKASGLSCVQDTAKTEERTQGCR